MLNRIKKKRNEKSVSTFVGLQAFCKYAGERNIYTEDFKGQERIKRRRRDGEGVRAKREREREKRS